jgi:hypothetical protein
MMRGKFAILALVLAIALAVMGRVLGLTGSREDSHVGLAVRRMTASPNRADTTPNRPIRAEERSTSKTPHQRLADADQPLVAEPKDQTAGQTGTKVIEPTKMAAENRAAATDVAIAPASKSLDDSVVGQPFLVSESILTACKTPRRLGCEPSLPLLGKMAEEPREEPWASWAERAIRALVELEPGTDRPREVNYTIRNLECRKTICFVETASHMKVFSTQFLYFEWDGRLKAGYHMFSTETKEDGTTVFVTLLPVMRVR